MQHRVLTACTVVTVLYSLSSFAIQAATINIVRDDVERFETVHGLQDNTATYGSDIAGAVITAHYTDGSSEQITWEADPSVWTNPDGSTYGSISGWATGSDVDLSMSWDGFEMMTSSRLASLSIDMAPANAVFDTTYIFDYDPNGGSTQGSSFGFPFSLYDGYEDLEGAITATYSGIVNMNGLAAAGDLFTTMTLDFSMLHLGGVLGDLNFRSDLDVMRNEGDLLSPVPLPMSLSFLLLGLGGLGLTRRVSKRRS